MVKKTLNMYKLIQYYIKTVKKISTVFSHFTGNQYSLVKRIAIATMVIYNNKKKLTREVSIHKPHGAFLR